MSPKRFDHVTKRLRETAGARQPDDPAIGHLHAIQEQIDAIARGDLGVALNRAHTDVEFEIFAPPEFPFVRRAAGIEALRAAIQQNFAAVEDQRPTIDNIVTEPNLVALFGEERGVIRDTGAPYHLQFVHKFKFLDGRLKSIRIVAARVDH